MSEDVGVEQDLQGSKRVLGEVDTSHYLIGVGASAGGLEAIKQLITQIPEGFGHSLVVIQHISPDHESLMPEILARETALTVIEVADNMPVEPGHIYLIPPKSNVVIQGTQDDTSPPLGDPGEMTLEPGLRFSLVKPQPRPLLNLPIDLFFQSLAEAVGDRSIAIVLSGTGSDGSVGLKAIKEHDGFSMVQEPDTAGFDGMPRSAIATKMVDLIAPPDTMISELLRYLEMRETGVSNIDRIYAGAEAEFDELLSVIGETAEIDFTQYKEPTLKRRIARRMGVRGCKKVTEYLQIVRDDPEELSVICRDFLVGVTNFFRDLGYWRVLQERVIPKIFAEGNRDEPVKVWSIGCSTGEEAYSLAILLEAWRIDNNETRDFRIFATDVNETSINAAKEGIYPSSILDEIPDDLQRPEFFVLHGGTVHMSRQIRHRVVLAQHNILNDAPYIRTDLITCRNLLIYLSQPMQRKVMSLFTFSLRYGGYLFLGAAENVPRHNQGFDPLVRSANIYVNVTQPRNSFSRQALDLEVGIPSSVRMPVPRARRTSISSSLMANKALHALFGNLLKQMKAAVFIVNDTGHILETFGAYQAFIDMPDQAFSSNIADVIEERLRGSLSLVMRRAHEVGHAEKLGVRMASSEGGNLDIYCRKIEWEAHPLAFAVTLQQTSEPSLGAIVPVPGEDDDAQRNAYVAQLEAEIEILHDALGATAEDLGVSNEELQTTNEELTASNEELQANNEEMQSINEELHTVNAENTEKILQLELASNDIENLLKNAELGMLLLDSDLRVRHFSDAMRGYLELTKDDIGRPLSNFAPKFPPAATAVFREDIQRANETGEETVREHETSYGESAYVRIRPYQGGIEDQGGGVFVTVLDTTEVRALQGEVARQRDRLEGILEAEAAGYWDWNIVEGTEYLSPRFKAMFGYQDDEMENSPEAWQRIVHAEDLPGVQRQYEAHVASRGKTPYINEIRLHHKSGATVWVLRRGRIVEWGEDGAPIRMAGAHIDITPLKEREQRVLNQAEELRRFAFISSHDLLQPINTIQSAVAVFASELPKEAAAAASQMSDIINTSVDRARARISGILDFSRILEDELDFEALDMNKMFRAGLKELEEPVQEANAEIEIDDLPPAEGSATLIDRVIQNLIINAVKYRSLSRPCRIQIKAAPAPLGQVGYQVIDNGIGIANHHRGKIFKLFARLHTDSDYEGLGVGLALCQRLIDLHGGTIGVEDGADGGCSFYFTLPEAHP